MTVVMAALSMYIIIEDFRETGGSNSSATSWGILGSLVGVWVTDRPKFMKNKK